MQKLRHFIVLAIVISLIITSDFYKKSEVSEGATVKVYKQTAAHSSGECVDIGSVQDPVYGEEFATLECDGCAYSIAWGIGVSWIDDRSGFPGFGYPIVVREVNKSVSLEINDSVVVRTSYGEYKYTVVSIDDVVVVDNVDLVKYNGDALIDYTLDTEVLVVQYGSCGVTARLTSGPVIVV